MKHYLVSEKSYDNLVKCFTDDAEMQDFGNQVSALVDEIIFSSLVANRHTDDPQTCVDMALRQFLVITIFAKNNMDLILQMMKAIEYREVSEQEKDYYLRQAEKDEP